MAFASEPKHDPCGNVGISKNGKQALVDEELYLSISGQNSANDCSFRWTFYKGSYESSA
jgi:hypothetical protein